MSSHIYAVLGIFRYMNLHVFFIVFAGIYVYMSLQERYTWWDVTVILYNIPFRDYMSPEYRANKCKEQLALHA